MFRGMPEISEDGNYLGPLPRDCGHQHPRVATGDKASMELLAACAAFPDSMNEWLASLFLQTAAMASRPLAGRGLQGSSPAAPGSTTRTSVDQVPPPAEWGEELVYVGRGHRGTGLPPTVWGNPYKVRSRRRRQVSGALGGQR